MTRAESVPGGLAKLLQCDRESRLAVVARLRGRDVAATLCRREDTSVPAPASYVQEQFLFFDRVDPGAPTYNISFAFHLRGELDVGALETALTEVVRRHEVLRTVIDIDVAGAVQLVHDSVPVRLPVVDLSVLPVEEKERRFAQASYAAARRGFAISRGPLYRAELYRLSDDLHTLLWVTHHAVADGQSQAVLIGELARLYRAARAGEPVVLPEPAVQYGDYAAWHRGHLSGPRLEELLTFWRGTLDGVPDLELVPHRKRPRMATFTGASAQFVVPGKVSAEIRALARQRSVTPFVVLLTAYRLALYAATGQPDLAIGTSVAGRLRPEVEAAIGPFLNVIAVRIDVSGAETADDVFTRTSTAMSAAFAQQELPFGLLVSKLGGRRDSSRNAIFQTLFELGGAGVAHSSTPLGADLRLIPEGILNDVAPVDLLMAMEDDGTVFTGRLDYNTDLADATEAARLIDHYQAALATLTAHPGTPVAALIPDRQATCGRPADRGE
ncbi:condensation domain-containing protein [Amycolatopsis keratiniphila]|uniref:Non-ribosomal synthetase n=1 Tax=Amycolatopsis keratiniphila TaxID=129921 RepID=R4SZG7_9PSEU|nr:condensation domain-containing protein [Amycolatopsis keratiniphila]AGM07920.1 non-ribosomal synthetase [Amycolatopsis keratiniphila]